jgi:hypothetical protein
VTPGLATIEAYSGIPTATAPLVAQWLSLTDGWAGRFLRPSQGRPVVYLESHLDAAGYRDILAGKYDARLREIRDSLAWAPDAIIRWDHEMDGPPNEWRKWGLMNPQTYKAGWRHVTAILGPMFWCPTSVTSRWGPYFPGGPLSHVGFDYYDRSLPLKPYPQALAKRIEECQRLAPGVPVLLGEFGTAAELDGRLAHLRTLDETPGLWGAVYFDVTTHGDDWRLTHAMRRVLLEMT